MQAASTTRAAVPRPTALPEDRTEIPCRDWTGRDVALEFSLQAVSAHAKAWTPA